SPGGVCSRNALASAPSGGQRGGGTRRGSLRSGPPWAEQFPGKSFDRHGTSSSYRDLATRRGSGGWECGRVGVPRARLKRLEGSSCRNRLPPLFALVDLLRFAGPVGDSS